MFIGVDSSTQSCKAVLVDPDEGRIVAEAVTAHPEGTAVDPTAWTRALDTTLSVLDERRRLTSATGIGVAGQQHGMVALDSAGDAVHDALLWNDTRSAPDARRLREEMGDDYWQEHTQLMLVPSFTITKLAWLARERPDAAARVDSVMLPHDYLNRYLTGTATTDRSDASGTGYFSAIDDEYQTDILERFFGRVPKLPPVLGSHEGAGHVTHPLLPSAIAAPGMGDNAAVALGLDLKPGEIAVSIGTSGTVFASTPRAVRDSTGLVAGFADALGGHLPLLATLNAARVLAATAKSLGVDLAEFNALAAGAPLDAEGLTMLPYLDGERTPNLPHATGSLLGITRTNLRQENIARAALLGILNSLADGLDRMRDLGVPVESVVLVGGGAKSTTLQRAAAGVFNVPIQVPEPSEYAALGGARQAAWTVTGELPEWRRPVSHGIEPSPETAGAFADVRGRYADARRTIHDI